MPEQEETGAAVSAPEAAQPGSAASDGVVKSPSVGVEQNGSRQVEGNERRGGPSPLEAQLRVQREFRDYMKRNDAFQKQVMDNLQKLSTSAKPTEATDFWGNPKEAVASVVKEQIQALQESWNQSLAQQQQQTQFQNSLTVADEYLAGLGTFTPQDLSEMKEIALESGIANHLQSGVLSPQEAAEFLHLKWAKMHGINPNTLKPANATPQSRPSKVVARSVPAQAPGAGPKQYGADELARMKGTPAFSKEKERIRAQLFGAQ